MPRTCGCGSKLPGPEWSDCGKAECIIRSYDLNSTRRQRTERFQDLVEVAAENRQHRTEEGARTQRAVTTTAKTIINQIAHENLLRMYAQMRSEDNVRANNGWDDE